MGSCLQDVNMNMVGPSPNKTVKDCPNFGYDGLGNCFVCSTCDCKFKSTHTLWLHIRIHIPRHERLLCPFCPFVSVKVQDLEAHLGENHLTGIVCRVCPYVATSRADLSNHVFRKHIRNKNVFLTSPETPERRGPYLII